MNQRNTKRNKLIRVVDRSASGWMTGPEHMPNELASDTRLSGEKSNHKEKANVCKETFSPPAQLLWSNKVNLAPL